MVSRDFTFASRTLLKSPAFTVTAVMTIALGIGASTAIFSVMNALLLKPLPYKDPERLAVIWGNLKKRNLPNFPFSAPDFGDVRRSAPAFEAIAGVNTFRAVAVGENAGSEQVHVAAVTPNFFQVMGAGVEIGRDFVESDGAPAPAVPAPAPGLAANLPPPPGPPIMAILSYEFWQHRYGGDPSIVGRNIETGFGKVQVAGVLAPGFQLLFPPKANMDRMPDIWQAARIDFSTGPRMDVFLRVVGRLKAGATFHEAQGQLDSIAADLRRRFPIKDTAGMAIELEPMQANLVADVKPAILALMGAVTFLLLIACANVANLLLVRASGRSRELAVRAALGGGRWDLIRQMLVEALWIAGAGAVAGLALAQGGIRLLIALAPQTLPRMDVVEIDVKVLAFTAFAALVAAAVFGIAPAVRASRPDVMEVLRAGGRSPSLGTASWMRSLVVTIEVALSFVLLIGSGLMVRSFLALTEVRPGYDTKNLLTFLAPLPGDLRTPEERAARIRQIRDRLRALPGVTAVTAALPLPLDGGINFARYGPDEAMADSSKFLSGNVHIVLPGYFEAMGTRLLEGRTFTEEDNAPGLKRVIVDDLLAAKMWPHQSGVGKRLLARVNSPEPQYYEVIGVVQHQRHEGLTTDGREAMFYMDGYFGHGTIARWAIRTRNDPSGFIPSVRAALARIDSRLAVGEVMPMSDWVDRAQAQTRFSLVLIAIFAGVAAVLASVGLFGVLSSAVRQRTAEIGLRMALGAAPGSVFGQIVGQGMKLSAIGIAVGVAAAFGLTRMMGSMLVGVKPNDPLTFGAIALLFFATTLIACALPARRAASLDPSAALRGE